jgi:predicted transcriptional regulator
MDATLEKSKIDIIQWITTIEDSNIIERINEIKTETKQDWWEELSEEEKSSIEAGLKDVENGNTISHEDVRKIYEKWL